jgi:hypothetical protein
MVICIEIQGRIAMRKARSAVVRKTAPRGAKGQKNGTRGSVKGLVGQKRFIASTGRYAQVAVPDANASTFGTDLLKVFRENVAKAREENMRLFGSPDRVLDNH